jgi:hypothetical protein
VTGDEALKRLRTLAQARAFGRHVGSDRLIQAALAHWPADQVVDGSLDPAAGADLIRAEVAMDLDYPDELEPVVQAALRLADRDENGGVPLEQLREDAFREFRALAGRRGPGPDA